MLYERILVAVDGSETSRLAMSEAIALAQDTHANLRAIYIADEFILVGGEGAAFDFKAYEASMRQYGQKVLQKMVDLAAKSGLSLDTALIENTEYAIRVPEKIVQEAEKWQADLLVIGTHGRRGISHLLLGSVAEGVIRLAKMPVLLVNKRKK